MLSDDDSDDCTTQCEWQWSERERGHGIVLHRDKLTVTFHPGISIGCTAIRGAKQLLQNMEHYFEVEMKGPFFGHARMAGIGTKHTLLHTHNMDYYPLLGRDSTSWALNYNGEICHGGNKDKYMNIDPDKFTVLRIGVHYDGYYGTIAFNVNGRNCGVAFNDIYTGLEVYPIICASASKCIMTLTQSHSSVMSLKALCRGVIRQQVKDEDMCKLPLPPHIRAYLSYQSHKPSPSPTVSSLDSVRSVSSRSSTGRESQI